MYKALAIALAFLVIFGSGYWIGQQRADKAWNVKWHDRDQADDTAKSARDKAAIAPITQEAVTYAKDTSNPVTDGPRILVCPSAAPAVKRAVRAATSAGSVDNGGAGLRAADPGQPTVWDSSPTVDVGKRANAQVKELKDYIVRVCQK